MAYYNDVALIADYVNRLTAAGMTPNDISGLVVRWADTTWAVRSALSDAVDRLDAGWDVATVRAMAGLDTDIDEEVNWLVGRGLTGVEVAHTLQTMHRRRDGNYVAQVLDPWRVAMLPAPDRARVVAQMRPGGKWKPLLDKAWTGPVPGSAVKDLALACELTLVELFTVLTAAYDGGYLPELVTLADGWTGSMDGLVTTARALTV